MWLTSFDPEGVWQPTTVTLLRRVRIGDRYDHAWARFDPAIALVHGEDVDVALLGARHEGFDIWQPGTWPIDVYICAVAPELAGRDEFTRDDVTIVRWGRLHETLE